MWSSGMRPIASGSIGAEAFTFRLLVSLPKPRALKRAARPGDGLRGWRVAGDGAVFVLMMLRFSLTDRSGVNGLEWRGWL